LYRDCEEGEGTLLQGKRRKAQELQQARDFFPTAPSVIKKRKRPQSSKKKTPDDQEEKIHRKSELSLKVVGRVASEKAKQTS